MHIDIHSAARIRDERTYFVIVAFLTLVGGLLRRYHLGQQSLWFDEADLVMRARQPLSHLLGSFVHPGENGPLYTLSLALWLKVFGTSEVAVRLPSAIAGTLAIPAMYGLGRELHGPRLGLIATLLLMISPYAHWYAQDAKMYSLALLLTIVSTWLLLVALRCGGRIWGVYVATMMVGLLVHATFLFVLIAHVVLLALAWRQGYGSRPPRKQTRILAIVLVLTAVPLLVWALAFASGGIVSWQARANSWQILHAVLIEFGATHRADSTIQTAALWLYLAFALIGIGMMAGVVRAEAKRQAIGGISVLAIAVVPVMLFLLLSLRQGIYSDRYLIVALPGYLLLVAFGFEWLFRGHAGRIAAIAGVVAVLALAWGPLHSVNLSTRSEKEDWRAAYRHIAAHQRPGDAIVIAPGYLRSTYDYYALRFPTLVFGQKRS